MLVEMKLVRIVISEINEHQVIYLKEVDGRRSLPILIGAFEATCIDRRVRGEVMPRPLTHDLLKCVIESLGGVPQDIVITALQEHTYFATIRIRRGDELLEVDSRPSDAIALAVHYGPFLPIYAAEDILGVINE